MPEIQYPTNPNSDTAFVVQDDGKKNRALMIAPQDISTLELPKNANSCKGYVTVDGKKQRVILTADISGNGGGSSLPDQTGHSGEFLTTDGTDASWAAVESLPSQTGQSGKFLTTDGTDASWGNALVNAASSGNGLWIKAEGTTNTIGYATSINTDYSANTNKSHIAISGSFFSGATPGEYSITIKGRATGFEAIALGGLASGTRSIAIGFGTNNSRATADRAIAIGNSDADAQGAIQIGVSNSRETNSDANTFKVANENGNFELMNANGNLPADRLASTTGLADGNYRLRLVMASGVPTLEWVAE